MAVSNGASEAMPTTANGTAANGTAAFPGPGNSAPDKPFYGPWLNLQGFDPSNNFWTLSVLVVAPDRHNSDGEAPQVDVDGHGDFPAEKLDSFEGWNFWRFEFSVELDDQERRHTYTLDFSPPLPGVGAQPYPFVAPALGKPFRWGFKSCDWFSGGVKEETRKSMGGYQPVFNDILRHHGEQPLHLMVGGGDQLYCDPVFLEVPELIEWSSITRVRDMKTAQKHPVSDSMKQNVSKWYFNHYMESFSRDKVKDVMATIPQSMLWDDHDIFDGWGSYPKSLQECPTFQLTYKIAERFYLLFQQHTTKKLAPQHGFVGAPAFHYVKCLTPEMALLGMDMRSERTLKHIISPSGYSAFFAELNKLPKSIKHLVVVSTVPVVYPEVPFSENGLRVIGCLNKHNLLWACTRKGSGNLLKFDEPELLDDLVDHWGSSVHKKERKVMVSKFQEYAKANGVRISFISGDVHLASVGLLYSNHKPEDLSTDHRYMINVTSSASVNVPPPLALVRAMQATNHASRVDSHTKEKMVRMFKDCQDFPSDKLMPRRNWCAAVAQPSSAGGEMQFQLRVEPQGQAADKDGFKLFDISAPPLKLGGKANGAPNGQFLAA